MIVVIGGSFDPVHFGHIRPAIKLASFDEVDEVRLIPCSVNPDKEATVASPKQRLDMLNLIKHDKLTVDTREIEKGGVSYTIDTIKSLREELGEKDPLAFVLGMDTFSTIDQWHNAKDLAELMHLIVLHRPNELLGQSKMWTQVSNIKELLTAPSGMSMFFDNESTDISSTSIRNMLAQQQQPKFMFPGTVWEYIRRNQLYGWIGNE